MSLFKSDLSGGGEMGSESVIITSKHRIKQKLTGSGLLQVLPLQNTAPCLLGCCRNRFAKMMEATQKHIL